MYNVLCTDIVQCPMFNILCTMFNVHCIMNIVHHTMDISHFTMDIVHCTLWCTGIFVHWLLYIVHWNLCFTLICVQKDSILTITTHFNDKKLAFVHLVSCLYGGWPPWPPFSDALLLGTFKHNRFLWNLNLSVGLLSSKEHTKNVIIDPSPSQDTSSPPKLQQSVILQEGSWHPQRWWIFYETWNLSLLSSKKTSKTRSKAPAQV